MYVTPWSRVGQAYDWVCGSCEYAWPKDARFCGRCFKSRKQHNNRSLTRVSYKAHRAESQPTDQFRINIHALRQHLESDKKQQLWRPFPAQFLDKHFLRHARVHIHPAETVIYGSVLSLAAEYQRPDIALQLIKFYPPLIFVHDTLNRLFLHLIPKPPTTPRTPGKVLEGLCFRMGDFAESWRDVVKEFDRSWVLSVMRVIVVAGRGSPQSPFFKMSNDMILYVLSFIRPSVAPALTKLPPPRNIMNDYSSVDRKRRELQVEEFKQRKSIWQTIEDGDDQDPELGPLRNMIPCDSPGCKCLVPFDEYEKHRASHSNDWKERLLNRHRQIWPSPADPQPFLSDSQVRNADARSSLRDRRSKKSRLSEDIECETMNDDIDDWGKGEPRTQKFWCGGRCQKLVERTLTAFSNKTQYCYLCHTLLTRVVAERPSPKLNILNTITCHQCKCAVVRGTDNPSGPLYCPKCLSKLDNHQTVELDLTASNKSNPNLACLAAPAAPAIASSAPAAPAAPAFASSGDDNHDEKFASTAAPAAPAIARAAIASSGDDKPDEKFASTAAAPAIARAAFASAPAIASSGDDKHAGKSDEKMSDDGKVAVHACDLIPCDYASCGLFISAKEYTDHRLAHDLAQISTQTAAAQSHQNFIDRKYGYRNFRRSEPDIPTMRTDDHDDDARLRPTASAEWHGDILERLAASDPFMHGTATGTLASRRRTPPPESPDSTRALRGDDDIDDLGSPSGNDGDDEGEDLGKKLPIITPQTLATAMAAEASSDAHIPMLDSSGIGENTIQTWFGANISPPPSAADVWQCVFCSVSNHSTTNKCTTCFSDRI